MTEYLLATCNSPNKSAIYCWNYSTTNLVHQYRSKCKLVRNTLSILCDDYLLIAEEEKPLLHLWPMNSEEPKVKLILPGVADAVCVDRSSTFLAVGIGVRVYIWMINSGELLNMLERNYQSVSCIRISNTTEHIVITGKDGLLMTYNFNNAISRSPMGQCEPLYIKTDNTGGITDVAVGNFGNKSRVVSVSTDKSCRVYNLNDGDPLKVLYFNYSLHSVLFDAMCWNIYVGDSCGSISIIELGDNALTQHIEEDVSSLKGHFDEIVSMDINMTNNILATASEDCSIIIWDLITQKQIHKMKQELPATSLRFVNTHTNINSKDFKPQVVLKPLKKRINLDIADIVLSINVNEDIGNEGIVKEKINNVSDNSKPSENGLKIVNHQLYQVLTAFIRKHHGNDTS